MLARALLAFLALELALYGWLAWRLPAAGFGPAAIVAVVLAIHVGFRVLPVLGAFAAMALLAPPPRAARPGALGLVRLLGRECGAILASYWLMPFERIAAREPPLTGPGAPRVVLVHGILCNRMAWWWFRRRLAARGHATRAVTLAPVLGDLDAMTDGLARELGAADAGRLVFVCHSMGGLVARQLLQRSAPLTVLGIATLGTPHQGSSFARIALGAAGRSLRPGSEWLRRLEHGTPPPEALARLSVLTWHDEMVAPAGSCRWPGAVELEFTGIGHMDLMWNGRVADAVAGWLDGLPGATRDRPATRPAVRLEEP